MSLHCGKVSPNMGKPLFDCSCVTSSSITSQWSMSIPSCSRTISPAIQFTGAPKPEKRAMDNHEISPGEDGLWLILQRGRKALDEIEQTLSGRLNMSAVLNVVRRPITFSRHIITSIEQRVERFQYKLFVVLRFPLHRNPSCQVDSNPP